MSLEHVNLVVGILSGVVSLLTALVGLIAALRCLPRVWLAVGIVVVVLGGTAVLAWHFSATEGPLPRPPFAEAKLSPGEETITCESADIRLRGHAGGVSCLVLSVDGRLLVSGGEDHEVLLWDFALRRLRHRCTGHETSIAAVAISPDGTSLLSVGDDTVRIWDSATGRERLCYRGHSRAVRTAAWCPSGRRVLSTGWDDTLRLWRPSDGEELRVFDGPTTDLSALAFSPCSKVVASGSEDGTIRLWDVASGRSDVCHRSHDRRVLALAFSPDGHRLFSVAEQSVVLLDRQTQTVRTLQAHLRGIRAAAFTPNGQCAVLANEDGAVGLWDVLTGKGQSRQTRQAIRCTCPPHAQHILAGTEDGSILGWRLAIPTPRLPLD